jgi:hypothetical protein
MEKDIKQVTDELNAAMLEDLEAKNAETKCQMRKIKAHYRLLKAKEAVRAVEMDLIK